ncbi:hypothetical protein [Helicobacter sp. UBA3407]|uniref:hypothetical protein n=1 Tax=Helicobacter sp. UBA3407 TaxID=1946588 RepID=UPI0026211168|nr:hypothetical protein [Helicobacter sp. UBA3407]
MQVSKLHNTTFDFVNADMQFDYDNDTDTFLNPLFFNTTENRLKGNAATDIFSNNNEGKEGGRVFINTNGDKYTNSDGSITKGGLLVAVMNANLYTVEGEATRWGQRQGFDKSMSGAEVKEAWNKGNTILKLQKRSEESLRVDKEWEEYVKNYKDPLTMFFENLQEQQKLSFEELERKRKELKTKDIKNFDFDA